MENFQAYARHLLRIWNGGDETRFDANETAAFARSLEFIRSQTYDIEYPDLKARALVPVDTSVPAGAETVTYRQWDRFGIAKIIANYGDDLPKVGMVGKEFTGKIKSIGVAYGYTIQDQRAASFQNVPLEQAKGRIAREEVEYEIDRICSLGDTTHGLVGILKHPNVPLVTPITGTWSTATVAQILADLHKLANAPTIATKERRNATTLVLPLTQKLIIQNTWTSVAMVETIESLFLKTNGFIKEIVTWNKCELANAANNGPRAMAYAKDPTVVQMVLPQDFEQLPPQPKNLGFEIPCHARCGGVEVRYPLAMAYMDGI